METLSKVWLYSENKVGKQRDVSQMNEHRQRYGLSGNCFDLAIWLLDEFRRDGVEAYPVGHDLNTGKAHVAVIALDEWGYRYLCDLGDQWITPILIDQDSEDFSNEKLCGFFPAANIQVQPRGKYIEILYHRPYGKISKQTYDTTSLSKEYFFQAAETSQNIIRTTPLIESRVSYQHEIAHWEFDNWGYTLSSTKGLSKQPNEESIDKHVEIINNMVGFDRELLHRILKQYREI